MKKLLVLSLTMLLLLSAVFIGIKTAVGEEDDPVRPLLFVDGKWTAYTDSPGYNFGEFPCNTEWLTFTTLVKWHQPPNYPPLYECSVVMTSSFTGTVFSPATFTLKNEGDGNQIVSVSIPIGDLGPGTYYGCIKPEATKLWTGPPGISDNPLYFYFTKVVCVVTAGVTFAQVGVGSDFTGTVLTVDGVNYGVADLPKTFTWDIGTDHTFAYGSPLVVDGGKRYVWESTSGLSTGQSGTITVPSGGGSVTGYYHTEYYLTVKTDPEGLVAIPGEGWYKEGTDVTLEAPAVSGYLFVYWDVDGTPVGGNPITVHMDAPHTATAHYWPELEYKQFVTDSSFNVIDHFDTVWTPKDSKKEMFKLASTNPGQFMLNIVIHNTWPVAIGPVTIGFKIDPDFILKGADPIQVWTGYGKTGTRITATVTYDPTSNEGTVTLSNIDPCTTLYITVHMEYGPAREYFTKEQMLDWKLTHTSNTFNCGYTVTVPGPFPFDITYTTSTTIYDPIVVLGLKD